MRALGQVESELLEHVTPEWRCFREILFEFNGPREVTIPQGNLQKSMDCLLRKKLVEKKEQPDSPKNLIGDARLYRRRAQ